MELWHFIAKDAVLWFMGKAEDIDKVKTSVTIDKKKGYVFTYDELSKTCEGNNIRIYIEPFSNVEPSKELELFFNRAQNKNYLMSQEEWERLGK